MASAGVKVGGAGSQWGIPGCPALSDEHGA